MRDDFTDEVKRTLAGRVNNLCSNPDCRAQTSGPQTDPAKVINVGVAAHITAASARGPRYSPALIPSERCSVDNGIWLCQNCAKLIDSDVQRFTEGLLRAWKMIAEDRARNSLGRSGPELGVKLLPKLELYLESEGIKPYPYSPCTPVRCFVLGLKNAPGCGSAKFPSLRYKRECGVDVDTFGIDGCGNFGLPRHPSDKEWQEFRGGVDHVVHAGDTLKITKLFQTGRCSSPLQLRSNAVVPVPRPDSRWFFDAINFRYEISAEGISRLENEKSIPPYETNF